jgi:hypothetical protein
MRTSTTTAPWIPRPVRPIICCRVLVTCMGPGRTHFERVAARWPPAAGRKIGRCSTESGGAGTVQPSRLVGLVQARQRCNECDWSGSCADMRVWARAWLQAQGMLLRSMTLPAMRSQGRDPFSVFEQSAAEWRGLAARRVQQLAGCWRRRGKRGRFMALCADAAKARYFGERNGRTAGPAAPRSTQSGPAGFNASNGS